MYVSTSVGRRNPALEVRLERPVADDAAFDLAPRRGQARDGVDGVRDALLLDQPRDDDHLRHRLACSLLVREAKLRAAYAGVMHARLRGVGARGDQPLAQRLAYGQKQRAGSETHFVLARRERV